MTGERAEVRQDEEAVVASDDAVVVEYEHWWDDGDSTPLLVGPFASITEAQEWAKEAWDDDYDPRWSVRAVRAPWNGSMNQRGAIRG